MRRCLLISSLIWLVSNAYATVLTNLSLSGDARHTTLSIRLTSPVTFHRFSLENPRRIVFDIDKTTLSSRLKKNRLHNALITQIRAASKSRANLRLVLDIKSPINVSVTQKAVHKGYIVTVNLKSKKPTPMIAVKSIIDLPQIKARDVVVLIDPGHGGKDPGAMGRRGVREKTVVLAIAKKLKIYVDQTPGMQAHLTRSRDNYVALRKRLDIARDDGADVFISIHADAYKNSDSHGVSVFALSQRGATSEAARWIAEKENYSELGGVDLSELNDESGLVRSVLIDLSQTATIGASVKLGEKVLQNLDNLTVLHHDGVEQARFVVLKSPDIPSILIETGFISNREEEKLLASSNYQQKIARSILKGLKYYFEQYPPRNSYLALNLKQYRVSRGDTLSDIAKRFHVSLRRLKAMNKLTSSHIKIGQQLMLPKNT